MSKLFKNNQQNTNLTPRQRLENKYNGTKGNLLLVVVFTVINLVLLITNANTYFLFSAYVPYAILDLAMFFCGKYPAEYYAELGEMPVLNSTVFYIAIAVAFVIVLLYFVSWLFIKKGKNGWLVFSLVFFSFDTAVMFLLNGIDTSMIMDILFHAWVIYSLAQGIDAYKKLKKLDMEEAEKQNDEFSAEAEAVQTEPVLNGEETNIENS